jgi:hypothetical protein
VSVGSTPPHTFATSANVWATPFVWATRPISQVRVGHPPHDYFSVCDLKTEFFEIYSSARLGQPAKTNLPGFSKEGPCQMQNDQDQARWRLFELRYRNLQAISKAQKVHLTTLLIEMTLLWTWYLSGSKNISVQGVALTSGGVWLAAPAVLSFFCLAFIGSINAALPAKKKLFEVGIFESQLGCQFSFYDLDTDKNVLDYFTFLKLSSTDNVFEQTRKYDVGNFLYPSVLLCCLLTTAFALWHLPRIAATVLYSIACTTLQLLFARRTFSRAARRFLGQHVDG